MSKLKIIVVITIMTTWFTGCSFNQNAQGNIPSTETVSEFTLIEIPVQTPGFSDQHSKFYKAPVTNIVYMEFRGFTSGGLVWIPDPDTGAPLKYDQFVELYQEYIPTEKAQGGSVNE